MMPSRRLLAVVALLASPLSASAAELPIIAKARARLGTEAAIESLNSVRYVGTLTTTDPNDATKTMTAKVEMVFVKPDRQKITATYDKFIETTALDAYEGWTRVQDASDPTKWRLTLLDAQQVKRLRANTWQSLAYFRGLEKLGGRVEDLGIVNKDGISCHKVAFIHEPKIVFYRYFDPASGRLILTETESGATLREEGEIVSGGVRFPKTLVTVSKTGNRTQTITLTYDRVAVNEAVPAKAFAVPAVR